MRLFQWSLLVFSPGCFILSASIAPRVCGDETLDLDKGEECDDGNQIDADGCEADCSLPACGNSIHDPSELCLTLALQELPINKPTEVALGDFNRDNLEDLVVLQRDLDQASLFLGNGDGSFQAQGSLTTGDEPSSIVLGDFNADLALDIVITNAGSNSASLFLRNGDGSFQTQVTFPTGADPEAVIASDFNEDTLLDLATANRDSNNISVLLGNGDGTFQPQRTTSACDSPPNPCGPVALIVGNFNSSSFPEPDIVTANSISGSVSSLDGNFGGNFSTPHEEVLVGAGPRSLVFAPFTQAGARLLVTSNQFTNDLSLLSHSTDLPHFNFRASFPAGQEPGALLAVDANNDLNLDLVVASFASQEINILLGNGDATFQNQVPFAVGGHPSGLVAADLNRDSRLDFVTANVEEDNLAILLSNP